MLKRHLFLIIAFTLALSVQAKSTLIKAGSSDTKHTKKVMKAQKKYLKSKPSKTWKSYKR